MSRWSKFASLPGRERIHLAVYGLELPIVSLALKIFGFKKLFGYLAAHPHLGPAENKDYAAYLEEGRRTAYLVSAAARHGFFRASCLQQSLLVWWLLRRRGLHAELRIGVRRRDGQILAHAWVRLGEHVISEGEQVEETFTAFDGITLD